MWRWLRTRLYSSREPAPATSAAALHGAAPDRRAADLLEACCRRSEALRQLQSAESRRDDRDYGRALMRCRQATDDVLRLELGR